jgi:dimethylaniline monooxygenase (N-oxide forming)
MREGKSMVQKRIAIIGAGPSGLTAAKACLEYGAIPTILECKPGCGGLWRREDGLVWNSLHTNLAKWSCSYSDYPWSADAPDFPTAVELERYLGGYVAEFNLAPYMRERCAVTRVSRSVDNWSVTSKTGERQTSEAFDGVVLASGVFGKPYVPNIAGLDTFKGNVIHSALYRNAELFAGRRTGIIGSSFSAVEIACDLAASGVEVVLMFRRSQWLLPRYLPGTNLPLDLALYQRGGAPADPHLSVGDLNIRRAAYFERTFGNPGDVHESLRVAVDQMPTFVAISDDLAGYVRRGGVRPVKSPEFALDEGGAVTAEGEHIALDALVLCTGFDCDLSWLEEAVRNALEYRRNDRFMPVIANKTVLHPNLSGLALVGMYRGPYFGVMELQGRWAAGVLSGEIAPPPVEAGDTSVGEERRIRGLVPQPQFPHVNYV